MIIIDTALAAREAEGSPIGVAIVGAGFMGRGLINQIVNSVPGMRVSVVVNRTLAKAEEALREAGVTDVRVVDDAAGVDAAVGRRGGGDHRRLPRRDRGATSVDAIVEATGAVEYGCHVVVDAIAHGKDIVLMNAEVDGTVGPILEQAREGRGRGAHRLRRRPAGRRDEPGALRARASASRPLVCGNIKGLQDEYRTPTTQAAFAEKWGQDPYMVTSFADGTKVSFEQAIVANATGHDGRAARACAVPTTHGHVDELTDRVRRRRARATRRRRRLRRRRASPGPGVFVLATHDDPKQRHYLNLYKLGEGPLYSFYTPYHLCHFEVPNTVARAVLFRDAALEPLGAPTVEVVTVAKTDLPAGTVIDGLGGYHTYGVAERADIDRVRPAAADRRRRGMPRRCATSRRTRCSRTTTSSCPSAVSSTDSARSRPPSCR